ncbi:hypothetical protein FHT80_006374 [Rhizobium sp. BK226]|nr:hypothetical protein [Rhizobium sp. BK226]MBB4116993.1 hypothetical protein [Rhizobium sp. BK226]
MKILARDDLDELAVKGHGSQPDLNQTDRGTVFTRRWSGDQWQSSLRA